MLEEYLLQQRKDENLRMLTNCCVCGIVYASQKHGLWTTCTKNFQISAFSLRFCSQYTGYTSNMAACCDRDVDDIISSRILCHTAAYQSELFYFASAFTATFCSRTTASSSTRWSRIRSSPKILMRDRSTQGPSPPQPGLGLRRGIRDKELVRHERRLPIRFPPARNVNWRDQIGFLDDERKSGWLKKSCNTGMQSGCVCTDCSNLSNWLSGRIRVSLQWSRHWRRGWFYLYSQYLYSIVFFGHMCTMFI